MVNIETWMGHMMSIWLFLWKKNSHYIMCFFLWEIIVFDKGSSWGLVMVKHICGQHIANTFFLGGNIINACLRKVNRWLIWFMMVKYMIWTYVDMGDDWLKKWFQRYPQIGITCCGLFWHTMVFRLRRAIYLLNKHGRESYMSHGQYSLYGWWSSHP